jgi:hypothetical protein
MDRDWCACPVVVCSLGVMTERRSVLFRCFAMLFFPLVLPAQTIVTGGFSGTITDPVGATVPGATLNSLATPRGFECRRLGHFRIADLPSQTVSFA